MAAVSACKNCSGDFKLYILLYCPNCGQETGEKPDFEKFLHYECDQLVRNGFVDKALGYIFGTIDDMCCAGEFSKINAILEKMKAQDTETNVLVALLSITLCVKERLESRKKFFADVKRVLLLREETQNRIDRLLSGLE